MKAKRIAAMIGVILLVLLYLTTLVSAIFYKQATETLFKVSLVLTVIVPIILWIFIWMMGRITGKRTIASTPEVKPAVPESEDHLE